MLLIAPAIAQKPNWEHAVSLKTDLGAGLNTRTPGGEQNYLYGLQVSYDRDIASRQQTWIQLLQAKTLSVGLVWHNLNAMKEIVDGIAYPGGQAIGALAELDFQLAELHGVRLLLTPGIGIAYLTETINTQPATSTIGSHINVAITGELSLDVPLGNRTHLAVAAHLQHYSNGAVRVPNGGWNAIMGNVGIKQAFGRPSTGRYRPPAYTPLDRNTVEFWLGTGIRGKYRDPKRRFFRTGAYAGYNVWLNEVFSLKMGSHLTYYHTVFDPARFDETFQYYGSSYDRFRWGVAGGLDASLGRFVVNAMYGKYLHYRNYHNAKWYWLTGLRYFITPLFGLQGTLYFHETQADYVNWGIIARL